MSALLDRMAQLSAAEEFFAFLDLPYEPQVVHVNRLHILKRFNQYLRITPELASQDEAAQRDTCRGLLARAYRDFVESSPAQEKVFKVFQDADGQRVSLTSLRDSLAERRSDSAAPAKQAA